MSNEIGVTGLATGLTLYATIRDSTNQAWNGSAFEVQVQANISTYAITMTENGTTGTYLGTFPVSVNAPAGVYSLTVRSRATGSPLWTDPVVGSDPAYQWSGTAAVSLASRMATYTQPTGFLAATFPTSVGTSTYAGGAVASVTAPVTVTGKPGVSLAAADVTGVLPADVVQWLGSACATPNTAGVPKVDLVLVLGSAPTVTSGAVDVNVVSMATDSLSDAAVSAAAVTKIQAGLAVGAVTLASGAITTATFASGTELPATALDAIAITATTGPADTFPKMVVQLWRRFFAKATRNLSTAEVKTFADDGTTVLTTQSSTDDGTVQTQGAAS